MSIVKFYLFKILSLPLTVTCLSTVIALIRRRFFFSAIFSLTCLSYTRMQSQGEVHTHSQGGKHILTNEGRRSHFTLHEMFRHRERLIHFVKNNTSRIWQIIGRRLTDGGVTLCLQFRRSKFAEKAQQRNF